MDDATEAIVLANHYTSVQPVVNAIAWLEHRAVARKGAVSADKAELLAEVTWWVWIQARHLAGVLLAFDQC